MRLSIDEMASRDCTEKDSLRSRITANLVKIEAARVRGWSFTQIAEALEIGGSDPAQTLRSYIYTIKRSEERRRAKLAKLAARSGSPVPVPPP